MKLFFKNHYLKIIIFSISWITFLSISTNFATAVCFYDNPCAIEGDYRICWSLSRQRYVPCYCCTAVYCDENGQQCASNFLGCNDVFGCPNGGGGTNCGQGLPSCETGIINPQPNSSAISESSYDDGANNIVEGGGDDGGNNNYYWSSQSNGFEYGTVTSKKLYGSTGRFDTEPKTIQHNPTSAYVREGITGFYWDNSSDGRVALYRCYNSSTGDHMLSRSSTCESPSWRQEGILGYVYDGTASGRRSLYRCYKGTDHMETNSSAECTGAGYTVEGIIGYPSDGQVAGTLPAHRCHRDGTYEHMVSWRGTETECRWTETVNIPITWVNASPFQIAFTASPVLMNNINLDTPCRNTGQNHCINMFLGSNPDSWGHASVKFKRSDGKKIARVKFKYRVESSNYWLNLDYARGSAWQGYTGWGGTQEYNDSAVTGENGWIVRGVASNTSGVDVLLDFAADWVGFGISARNRDGTKAIQVWDVELVAYEAGPAPSDLTNVPIYHSSWDDGKWGTAYMKWSFNGGTTWNWDIQADVLPPDPNTWSPNVAKFNYRPLRTYNLGSLPNTGQFRVQFADACKQESSVCSTGPIPVVKSDIIGTTYNSSATGTSCNNLTTRALLGAVNVTVRHGGTGQQRSTTSNSSGVFSFIDLDGGIYSFNASKTDYNLQFTCSATGASISSLTIPPDGTVNFGLSEIQDPWWQSKDGDIHGNDDVYSSIPNSCTGSCIPYLSLDGSGTYPGVVSSGSLISVGTYSEAKVSEEEWQVDENGESTEIFDEDNGYIGGKKYDYEYFSNNLSIDGSFNGGKPGGNGVYFADDDQETTAWTGNNRVKDGEWFIILIDGKLTIGNEIKVDEGGFLAFVVKEDIIFDKDLGLTATANLNSAKTVEGIYIADGFIRSLPEGETSNKKLFAGGMFIADADLDGTGGFDLTRDIGTDNADYAAEYFEYRPDFLVNFPQAMGKRRIIWKEVAP